MYTWDLSRVLMKEHDMKGWRGHESLDLDPYDCIDEYADNI